MKKLIAILFASVMFSYNAAMADLAVGVSANFASLDTDGSETELTGDTEVNSTSVSEDVVIPEIFVEAVADNGFAIGLSYIPARELGTKTRTDTTPTTDDETADAGDYKATADLDSVIMVYTDIPLFAGTYAKLGVQRAELLTKEQLNGDDDYEDAMLLGYTAGLGYRGALGGNGFYKIDATYTDFAKYSDVSANNEAKVQAETEVMSLKFSVGVGF